MRNATLTIGTLMMAAGMAVAGTANLRITEIYAGGLPGDDGTPDWFELTNDGPASVSTSGLFYDDDSFDATKNDTLSNLTIGAGESVVFLVSWEDDFATASDAIATFATFWGSGFQIGTVDDGSGLGGGGDAAAIFDNNTMDAGLVASASYIGDLAGTRATIEYPAGPVGQNSVLGVNGAYESLLTAGDDNVTLIGSPGVVPAPGGFALLAIGGLTVVRRRR